MVIYNIELVSYFLPIPITIRRRSLLLPLANPNTSEIITNHPPSYPLSSARADSWRRVTPRRKLESWRRSGGSQEATSRPSKTSSSWEYFRTRHSQDGARQKEKGIPIHNQVRLWFSKISSSGFWGSSAPFPSGALLVLRDWDLQSASQLDSSCLHLHSSLRSIWWLPAPFRLLSPSFLSAEERKRRLEDSRRCVPQSA